MHSNAEWPSQRVVEQSDTLDERQAFICYL